jgi:DNA-binding CsgD family transcriptional regulator
MDKGGLPYDDDLEGPREPTTITTAQAATTRDTVNPSTADTRLAHLSALLLEIYQLAREEPIDRFHDTVLDCLATALPFEKAWWGRAALTPDGPFEQSSHLYGLPERYLADWQAIRADDITIQRVHAVPGQAVIIDTRAPGTPSGLRALGENHGFGEFLCVVHLDPITQLSDHLSLYRPAGAAPFGADACRLLECVMPHLAVAVALNQIRTLMAMRESLGGQRLALAVCNREGVLYGAETGFTELLRAEWPGWVGPRLPVPVLTAGYEGKRLQIDVRRITDLYLLTARGRCAIEQLSARENDVARLFGEGLTYKEIARTLEMSPHTVRHHLRSIYAKLGVRGKAGIAHLLHEAPPTG